MCNGEDNEPVLYHSPLNLELTASSEVILMDNIEIFRKNGFEFLIDEQGELEGSCVSFVIIIC